MIKRAILFLIRAYQNIISPFFAGNCRFYPSCSEYSYLAIEKQGVLKGAANSFLRILRCGWWNKGGVDYPKS